jgi:hypothetical protein
MNIELHTATVMAAHRAYAASPASRIQLFIRANVMIQTGI